MISDTQGPDGGLGRSPSRRSFIAGVGAAVIAAASCSSTDSPIAQSRSSSGVTVQSTTPKSRPSAPSGGDHVLLLAGQGPRGLGGRPDLAETDGYLDRVATPPDGITRYVGLRPDKDFRVEADAAFATYLTRPDLANAVVHLSVPWISENDSDQRKAELQNNLTNGSVDDAIDQMAEWCRATPHPILLRLGYEFDREPPKYYDPTTYARNFRYIVERFRAHDTTNVATVWASANLGAMTPDHFKTYYPGDAYVDWFGMSMFLVKLDELLMSEARQRNKPVLIAESTPITINIGDGRRYPLTTDDVPGTPLTDEELWAAWFEPAFRLVGDNADAVRGFHYIPNNWADDPMWSTTGAFAHCDGRVWANPDTLARWTAATTAAPFRAV